jgi:hypothetical protein
MSTKGEKSLHYCLGPLPVCYQIYGFQMVVWSVWHAIGESDGSYHLKSSIDPGGPGWLRKVTVYSHASTGGFGKGVSLEN